MTARHFRLVAATVRDLPDTAVGLTDAEHARVALAFAEALAGENGRFDRERFMAAALPPEALAVWREGDHR